MKSQIPQNLLKPLFLIILAFNLTACGGEDEPAQATVVPSETAPVTSPEPELVPEIMPEPVPATHSATLSWNIPDSRQNGDPLAIHEIGGYHVQYKLTTDQEYVSIMVNDAQTLSYNIENLGAGSYEFRVASFDIDDQASLFSTPVSADF